MKINLPRLLNASMGVRDRLHPTKAAIKRNLYSLHTASMNLPPEEPAVKERDWIALYDRYGSAGIFRVSRMRTAYGQQSEINLKHGFCVLEDDTLKVTDASFTGTAEAVMRHLFSRPGVEQAPRYWTFGTFVQTPSITVEYSNTKLMDVAWQVLKKLPGYAFTFDQSVFPWVLGLKKLNDADACEGRFGRNLNSCTVDVDDSALCTRVYLDDRDGYTDADTVSTWGVVSTTLSVPDGANASDVAAYTAAYLNENKNPRIAITLNAADMSAATGETLDRFRLGAVCRACLPKYKTTVRERIVALVSPDVYGDPDRVEISMSNRTETAGDLLAKLRKNTSDLDRTATVTGRRVGGIGRQVEQGNIELIRQAELLEDTRLRMSRAGIVIDGDAQFVKTFVYQETFDQLDESVRIAEAEILVQAGLISQKVSVDGVIGAINLTPEEALIMAKRINLSGYVTMSSFEAEIAKIDNIFAGYSEISALGINGNLYAKNANITDNLRLFEHYAEWQKVTLYKGGKITVSGTTNYTVYDTSGNPIGSVRGIPSSWSLSAYSNGTYNFLGY